MPPSLSPSWLRRALFAGGASLVAAAGLAMTGATADVRVVVDDRVHELQTSADTVADVLDELGLVVGAADEMSHAPAAPVEDGLAVTIDRAITVDVEVHGATARRITAPVSTVTQVLHAADMDDLQATAAEVTPGWNEPVEDGDTVVVTLPVEVVVEVDGDQLEGVTLASSVSSVLDDEGVELGPDDIVEPAEGSRLVGPTTITVRRVDVVEETEEVTLERDVVRRETDDLDVGETEVERRGRAGLRVDTYRVTRVEGDRTERELVDRNVEREPRDLIVLVGTNEPTPEPPPDPEPELSSEPEPDPEPEPGSEPEPSTSGATSSGGGDGVWDRLARCESGGNWSANTGNGYYGGLQFHPSTWRSVGGSGLPHQASRDEQIQRGRILQERSGWEQWPACTRKLGLR